jgi:hypothetical protein
VCRILSRQSRLALADVGAARAERLKAGHLGGPVIGAKDEVEAVLDRLHLARRLVHCPLVSLDPHAA